MILYTRTMLVCLLFLVLCSSSAMGFNVDTVSRVVHRGPPDSMFGFTVQLHTYGSQKMVLVGAPEDDTRRRPEVEKPGSVYRCEPTYASQCREIVFDSKGNARDTQQRQIDQKSNQWFGATLTSTGVDGPIVACAPRYVSYVSAKLGQRDPVGSCFFSRTPDGANVKEISPCRTSSHTQRILGVCQAGFSAAVAKENTRLFLGAPGSFYWQGRTFSIDPNGTFNYFVQWFTEEGQIYTTNPETPTLIATGQDSAKYDDSYMGYSMAVGDFAGRGVQAVAVGVPRGSNLRGLVVLYTWDLQVIRNISGSQIGAYFGYSLASGDVDGDGLDDVIIGAPMYSRPKAEGYEHGRVYVVYQGHDKSYSRSEYRTGEISKGRFGLAVTSLGDINLDGFGDLAVGAPYSGKNGRGMVFIYYGNARGLGETYSQAIAAEDVDPTLTTFGFSVSGGVDLDMNNFTDLAVGAYKSDSVVFFRSRPVIKMTAALELHSFNNAHKQISLDDRSCTLSNRTKIGCAQLNYCLKYDAEDVYTELEFGVIFDLDAAKTNSKRLYVIHSEERHTKFTRNVKLTKGKIQCGNVTVYLIEEVRDKLTPLEIAMTYDLKTQRAQNIIPPILDQTMRNVFTDSLNIQKNCGSDNVCIPDLQMSATTSTVNYLLGSDQKIDIDIEVENAREDAFEAAYYLHIPKGVTYNKMQRLDSNAEALPVYCRVVAVHDNGSTVKCDMGNPLPSGRRVKYRITMQVAPSVTSLEFDMETNSTNAEQGTDADNKQHMSISVLVEARLLVIGTSDPPDLQYNATAYDVENMKNDTKLGPKIIHKYNIKNEGPFAAEQTKIYILWPYQTLTGENLMYMLVQPQTVGPVTCDFAHNVNPMNIFVTNPYNFVLRKELDEYRKSEFSTSSLVGSRTNEGTLISGLNRQGNEFISGNEQTSGTSVHGYQRENGQAGYGTAHNGDEYLNNEASIQASRATGSQSANSGRIYNTHTENGRTQDTWSQNGGYGGNVNQGIQGNTIVRQRNRTIVYDSAGNIVSQTESSTEFNALGHEGEAGSSFSRYGSASNSNRGQYAHNQQYGGSGGQDQWTHNFDSSATNDQRHSWSTEETVNREIMNAGSRTYHNAGSNTARAGLTVVGGDEDEQLTGFGANAAYNPNNEFRTGYADVSVGGSQGGHAGSRSFESQGGSQSYAAGGSQGGAMNGGGYARSGSNGGYSYSSSSNSGSGGSHYSYSSQGGGTAGSWNERRDNTRRRRQVEVSSEIKEAIANCEKKFKCELITCTAGRLEKGQDAWIALRARFNASVLNEITKDRAVTLSTMALAEVVDLPLVGKPTQASLQKAEAQTVITQQLEALTSGTIPLWVVILAAVVGALLLLLLIFALYKCGFFERNRPTDTAERQPLNGRDEHL